MLKSAFQFLARLPIPFSLSLVVFIFIWIGAGYDFIVTTWALPVGMRIVVSMAGIILAYNLAVLVNYVWVKLFAPMTWLDKRMISLRDTIKKSSQLEPNTSQPRGDDFPWRKGASADDTLPKIGIILAGGGAKGAYQAGAMKAIHEYLERGKLLEQVTMMAGSSIGSWNALFWLADLVRPLADHGATASSEDKKSIHQLWWEHVSMQSLLTPRFYFPLLTNALISVDPWKKQFDKIFVDPQANQNALIKTAVHFYLTKANIVSGKLDFTTNKPSTGQGIMDRRSNSFLPEERDGNESWILPDRYTTCHPENTAQYLEDLKEGVFASMTFPPLIPQHGKGAALYEDGGVIDNLPIYFGSAIEDCDYLFILPLNASSGVERQQINTRSMIVRLTRVLGVRQGSQEQQSLRQFGLSNEIKHARRLASKVEERVGENQYGIPEKISGTYLDTPKTRAPVGAFAICPDNIIVETFEFWKTEEMGEAFNIMYRATAKVLQEKDPLGVWKTDTLPSSLQIASDYEVQLYKVESIDQITEIDLEGTPI